MKRSPLDRRLFLLCLVTFPLCLLALGEGEERRLARGRELFMREWLPDDARSHAGDGLGPVFNDSSCVACHNQGGCGGAGPSSKNIQILSAVSGQLRKRSRGSRSARQEAEVRSALAAFHPGFREADAVVLHRFSTDEDYGRWLETKMGGRPPVLQFGTIRSGLPPFAQVAGRSIVLSERNPSALFGAGVIDSIPAEVIEEGATSGERAHLEDTQSVVTGRVSRLKDGRVGRFGWKGQMASLEDFTRAACAVELGLEVPGQHQAGLPHRPEYRAPGADLTGEEVGSLVAFVRSLPAPRVGVFPPRSPRGDGQVFPPRSPRGDGQRAPSNGDGTVERGQALFAEVGCAACHVPDLGPARGLYSDLLLHDMGAETAAAGSYGVFTPEEVAGAGHEKSPGQKGREPQEEGKDTGKEVLATASEWRTPPLWGVRDSAPYLHDGRADTLEEAVFLHGGEAQVSLGLFRNLSHRERGEVIAFLRSLVAPE